jgi:hypothetical protein
VARKELIPVRSHSLECIFIRNEHTINRTGLYVQLLSYLHSLPKALFKTLQDFQECIIAVFYFREHTWLVRNYDILIHQN